MRTITFLKKAVFPIMAAITLAALFYPLCVENGRCDYLKLWIFIGIPFGVKRMFIWIVPKNLDIGGTVGVVVMNLLVGGVIGGFVLVYRLVEAAITLCVAAVTGVRSLAGISCKK